MWRRVLSIMAVVCLLGGSASALAQAPSPYKQRRDVTFTKGDTISGNLVTSGGNWIDAPLKVKFKTLIEYRYDFVPEMIAASEDI